MEHPGKSIKVPYKTCRFFILLGHFSQKDIETYQNTIRFSGKVDAVLRLGQTSKILVNNVLILEINSKGILTKKDFLNKDNLKDFEISTKKTLVNRNKQSFLDKTLNSLRQKINDPLGKQKVK